MTIRFEGPVVMVRDMKSCRTFYEGYLERKVLFAVGEVYTMYAEGLSLWDRDYATLEIFGRAPAEESGAKEFELYFECAALEELLSRMEQGGVPLLHELREQPWGQRCFRVSDPEGNAVEIAEPMGEVVKRFQAEGLEPEAISSRTMMPLELVRRMLAGECV